MTDPAEKGRRMTMATNSDIHVSVITPEAQVVDVRATGVVIPAHDGLIGILYNRAPLLCELGKGTLRIDATDGMQRFVNIEGGFAQVLNNEVVVLTDKAAEAA